MASWRRKTIRPASKSRDQYPNEIGSGPYTESHREAESKGGPEIFALVVTRKAGATQAEACHSYADRIIVEDGHVHERRINRDRKGGYCREADAKELGDNTIDAPEAESAKDQRNDPDERHTRTEPCKQRENGVLFHGADIERRH